MTSQEFLFMTAGTAIGLLALFMIRSRPKAPPRLKMRSDASSFLGRDAKNQKKALEILSQEVLQAQNLSPREKNLNVLFNYNGHTWDAYEVLGLPAGCSLEQVQLAYEKEWIRVDAESRAFLDTAYEAIRSQRRSAL